jgi:hypothetical protein
VQTLFQFLTRLSFGMAAAMLVVPPRQVTSGYYRNNLYVLLGLDVLASMLAWMAPVEQPLALWPPLIAAAVCYLGTVVWLYELAGPGMLALAGAAAANLASALISGGNGAALGSVRPPGGDGWLGQGLWWLDPVGEGGLLGVTMAAMLLGHWYLNAPGMALAPLKRLVALLAAIVILRTAQSGVGLALQWWNAGPFDTAQWIFIAMRWTAGLAGTLTTAAMAWQTLKIPNTQSATGILYVGVIFSFIGELTAQLLSRQTLFPL